MAASPSFLDRLLRRKPAVTGNSRSDSGRGHYDGFLDFDELNSELRGRQGLDKFDEMWRSDPDVRRSVVMSYSPAVNASWSVDPHGGEEASDEDQQIADDLAWALGIGDYWAQTPLLTPLTAHLAEAFPSVMRRGFTPFEITWGRVTRTVTKPKPQDPAQEGTDGKPGAKKADPPKTLDTPPGDKAAPQPPAPDQAPAAPEPPEPVEMVTETRDLLTPIKFGLRLPRTIHRWMLDDNGELIALEQFRRRTGEMVTLPREDLLYYRVGVEGDNYEGESMLRPAYKPWYIKDRVERLDAMGQEREAIGLPTVYPPIGVNSDDARLTDLEDKLAKLRAGELAYLIMPGPSAEHTEDGGWLFKIEGLSGGGNGGTRDAHSTLNYHRDGIAAAFIAEFMRLGQGKGASGARATAGVQQDPFLAACQSLADIPRLELNKVLIRRWVTLNYGPDKPCPTLNVGFADQDLESLVDFVAQLVGAGAIHPDDKLEDALRERGKLPAADPIERQQRKDQQQQQQQAELEATKHPDPAAVPGAKGSDKSTTKQRLPGGGERVTEKLRHLDDTHTAKDAAALQVTPRVAGHCPCGRKGCPCDGGPGCTFDDEHHLADGELRDWEQLMPLTDLAKALDQARDVIAAQAAPHVAQVAALAAKGGQQIPDPTAAFAHLFTEQLTVLHQLGAAAVRRELDAQRTSTPATLTDALVDAHMLADSDQDNLAKAGWLAAKAVITTVWTTVQRRLLSGAPEATALDGGEQAGKSAARSQATQAGPAALSQGREDTADDLAHLIRGARYTSILDANRCEQCALADDGVLRRLDDPVRVKRKPPNPDCYGWDKCRCIEFYELNDEAPAYLEAVAAMEDGRGGPFVLFDPAQVRDQHGRWTDTPHPGNLAFVKHLGGTTGARLMRDDATGGRYVTKKGGGAGAGHLLEEDAADRAYRAMGVAVPHSQVHSTDHGPVKVAGFLEHATPLADLTGVQRHQAHAALAQDFALDAVLSNWDVVGMDADNVLVRNGVPYRVDNGGALRYRAMGKPKTALTDQPVELWTLRESSQGHDVFGHLSWEQIVSQSRAVLAKRTKLLDALPGPGQRKVVAARLDALQQVVAWHDEGIPEALIRDVVAAKAKPAWTLDASAYPAFAGDQAQLDEEVATFILAAEWTPALHPRDDNGRFKVKVGGHALEVLAKSLGKHAASMSPATQERLGAILGHKTTSTHASSKGGGTTVNKHELAVSHTGALELGELVDTILAEGGHKQHANSSSAKQSLLRLQKQLAQAEQAAEHHKAQGTYHIKRGPGAPIAMPADATPTPPAHGLGVGDQVHQPKAPNGTSTIKQVTANGVVMSHGSPGEDAIMVPATHETITGGLANGFFAKGPHPADAPAPAPAKGIKGPQPVPGGVSAAHVDLAKGDVVQIAKGGNKITLSHQAPGGAWVGHKSNGKQKVIYNGYHLHQVTKADGSALKLKDSAWDDAPSPGPGGIGTIAKDSLKTHEGGPFSELPAGTVFETLQGKMAVLDPDTAAYTGYVSAWDIDTGAKYEVPAAAAPGKSSTASSPAQAIANAKAKTPTPAASSAGAAASAVKAQNKHISVAESWESLPNGQQSKSKIAGWQKGTGAKLDQDQKSALQGYTDGSYSSINNALREDSVDVYKLKQIQALDSVFDTIDGIPEDIVTHRGTHEGALTGEIVPGKVIFDKGFMSTSPTKPWHKPVILHIRLKKGSKALWGPTTGADVTSGEDEIILRRSTMMQVLDVQDQGGVKHIYVEAYA